MDSETEKDPFDLNFSKKVRIKEFLVFMKSEEGQDCYVIKKFENTKEQNLETLKFIQEIIFFKYSRNFNIITDKGES